MADPSYYIMKWEFMCIFLLHFFLQMKRKRKNNYASYFYAEIRVFQIYNRDKWDKDDSGYTL